MNYFILTTMLLGPVVFGLGIAIQFVDEIRNKAILLGIQLCLLAVQIGALVIGLLS